MKDAANIAFMDQALRAAAESITLTSPNPRVGCVLVSAEGQILGIGHTQRAGGPHAEIVALRDAAQKGNSVQGGIAFVTMEPCSHHGRTGPCCEALAKAGIKKVIASISDPNPIVAGCLSRVRLQGVSRFEYRLFQQNDPKDTLGQNEDGSVVGRKNGLRKWR